MIDLKYNKIFDYILEAKLVKFNQKIAMILAVYDTHLNTTAYDIES